MADQDDEQVNNLLGIALDVQDERVRYSRRGRYDYDHLQALTMRSASAWNEQESE
jgi:hypothetical protein